MAFAETARPTSVFHVSLSALTYSDVPCSILTSPYLGKATAFAETALPTSVLHASVLIYL